MNTKELEVIKQGILNEIEGYEFYKMAANSAKGESKIAFLELANEELKHVEYLKALFSKIQDNNDDEFKLAMDSDVPSPDIYNWDKVNNDQTSLSMSVFGIGIQMEKDSILFYEDARDKTEYEEARKLYNILIKWEQVHLDQFIDQYEIQKRRWWSSQSFAPF